MPCHSAIVKKLKTITPDTTVEEALALLKKNAHDVLPVVDDENILCGYFNAAILLKNILPIAVDMGGGAQIDLTIGAGPGVAKRLKKIQPLAVGTLMNQKPNIVSGETPTWEGVKLLAEQGAPLFVVEDNGKLMGMMTEQSAIEELERLQD